MKIEEEHRSDFTLLEPKTGMFYHIYEGTGDNLLREDEAEGYVDYINYETMYLEEGSLTEYDGGMVLLKEYYSDLQLTDIIAKVFDMIGIKADMDKLIYVREGGAA